MDYYYWILLSIVVMIISMFLGYMIIKYNFSSYPKLKELFLDKINGNNKNYMNFGYLNDLSVLDLLFNCGDQWLDYF